MKTVLVIDDMQTILKKTRSVLEAAGFTVETALDWADALPFMSRSDIVLVDYNMPGFNGEFVASTIKKTNPQCTVLFYSTEEEKRLKELTEAAKADGFIRDKGDYDSLIEQLIDY